MAVITPPRVEFGHLEPTIVYFDDLDAMGVLHNARYPILVERSISRYWATRGYSFENGRPTTPDVFHVVREFTITYREPIRGTGWVNVHFWLERLGTTGADYGFRFLSADCGSVHAEGRRAIVRLDPTTMRPAPWSDKMRADAVHLLRPQP
ncbi:MAG TPA: thioesterase family protein [Micromonosporaceae bacterium]